MKINYITGNSLAIHNEMKFSTVDQDNDVHPGEHLLFLLNLRETKRLKNTQLEVWGDE